jgi:CheY-specific phosphatase CheX
MNNESGKIHSTVDDIFQAMGNELFSAYTLHPLTQGATAAHTDISGESMMSVLSAAGEGIKLLFTIKMGMATAHFIYPSHGAEASVENLHDLCGELNNQLVGKIKNRLLAYDCRVMLGLPTLVSGKDIESTTANKAQSSCKIYHSAGGNMVVHMYTTIHPAFTILDAPNEDLTGAVAGGELSFF